MAVVRISANWKNTDFSFLTHPVCCIGLNISRQVFCLSLTALAENVYKMRHLLILIDILLYVHRVLSTSFLWSLFAIN